MEVTSGFKQTEVGVIPEDWEAVDYVTFGQIIDGDRGNEYPGAGDLLNRGYCLFLNAGNVTKDGFRFLDCQFITADKDQKLHKGKLIRGDVVLTTRGTIGNFAYFNETVPYENVRINSGMVILRNESLNVSNDYQYLVLQSYIVSSQIARLSFGSAQPQLTVKGISTLKIPIPRTKAEQQTIAKIMDDVSAFIKCLGRILAKKREIKQGVLQQLLTGKKRLPGFSEDWKLKQLGQLGRFLKGRGVAKADSLSGRLPCVRYGEIYTRHDDYIREFYSWISPEIAATATRLECGDVLFAASGETKDEIGKCAAFVHKTEAYAGGDIIILRPDDADPLFLGYYLNSSSINRQKASRGQGDAIVHINSAALSDIRGKFPERAEQAAISAVLYDIDVELAAIDARRRKLRAIQQGMMQELLTGRIRLL